MCGLAYHWLLRLCGCCVPATLLQIAGEKEYYLATAFEELYIAPTANVRLAGFSVAGE